MKTYRNVEGSIEMTPKITGLIEVDIAVLIEQLLIESESFYLPHLIVFIVFLGS